MKPNSQENDDEVVSTTTEYKDYNSMRVEDDESSSDYDEQHNTPSTSFKIHLKRRMSPIESEYNYDRQASNSDSSLSEPISKKYKNSNNVKYDATTGGELNAENSPNVYMNRSILKKTKDREMSDDRNMPSGSDAGRIKKKVRIDETEGLKAKQELSQYESQFTARALPGKIMRSKLSRIHTDQVKVSPITIRSARHEKKGKKKKKKKHRRHSHSRSRSVYVAEPRNNNEVGQSVSGTSEVSQGTGQENQAADVSMSKEDQIILLEKLLSCIPPNDNENYGYRLNHLDWQNITFKNYTSENCKKECFRLLKSVRQYRLLSELITDAQRNITGDAAPIPDKTFEKHPDMPKKPLSSYFIFYLKKKDKIAKEHPGSDASTLSKIVSEIYSKMSLDKKRKYEELAAKNRRQYKIDLQKFYIMHPEYRNRYQRIPKNRKDCPPKKPDTPYNLFIKSELGKEAIDDRDKAEFKHFCKEKWEHMPDDKKLVWINLAEEYNEKYQEEMDEYVKKHPEYTPKVSSKSVLSKKETKLKDKLAGKPKKPPSTAYSFFVSEVLQSPEISGIPVKERMNYCSGKWKQTTQDEKDKYRLMFTEAHAEYERNYEIYLHSLPEEKRKLELLGNATRKKKIAVPKRASNSTWAQKVTAKRGRPPKVKQCPPVTPPRSLFKYFASKYEGDCPREAWNALSRSVKKAYKKERMAAQSEYLKEYEAYLKSLKKDELKAACEQKKQQLPNNSSDNTDSGDNLSSSDDRSASDNE